MGTTMTTVGTSIGRRNEGWTGCRRRYSSTNLGLAYAESNDAAARTGSDTTAALKLDVTFITFLDKRKNHFKDAIFLLAELGNFIYVI